VQIERLAGGFWLYRMTKVMKLNAHQWMSAIAIGVFRRINHSACSNFLCRRRGPLAFLPGTSQNCFPVDSAQGGFTPLCLGRLIGSAALRVVN